MTSTTEAPKRGRGRPVGALTEISIMPVFSTVPMALVCLMCGQDYGEYEVKDLPRGILYCGRCNGRVMASGAAPRTNMGTAGSRTIPRYMTLGGLSDFYD